MASTTRRLVGAGAWTVAGGGAGLAVTQTLGWSGLRVVAIAQSLTPWIALACVPAGAVGALHREGPLTVAATIGAVGLGAVVSPALGRPRRRPDDDARGRGGPTLTIVHQNMLYENVRDASAAARSLLGHHADVLVLSEFTAEHQRALFAHGSARAYPHRVGSVGQRSEGIVVWSRWPLTDCVVEPMDNRPGISAVVHHSGAPIRVVAAHPDPPTMRSGLREWSSSMRHIDAAGSRIGPPTVIVADFNAARWHPVLRRVLRRGWRDAHEVVGRGMSSSWPSGRRVLRPFVRLDHALLDDDVDLVHVHDVETPGSDHRGFVLEVRARHPPSAR